MNKRILDSLLVCSQNLLTLCHPSGRGAGLGSVGSSSPYEEAGGGGGGMGAKPLGKGM